MSQDVSARGNIEMLVPIEMVTSKRRCITSVAVTHGQVQRNHAVAAGGVRERVRRSHDRGGSVCRAVPRETVAGERRRVACVAVAYR